MYTPFDTLLEEVAQVSDAPGMESIRKKVTRDLVEVYRNVDSIHACYPEKRLYTLSGEEHLQLDEYTIRIEGILPGRWDDVHLLDTQRGVPFRTMLGDLSRRMPALPRYTQYADRIYFDQPVTGDVTVFFLRIPLDPNGVPMVDDRLYQAAVLYSQSEQARISLHKKNRQSFSAAPFQIDRQLANQEIAAARARFNALSKTDWLQLYADLKRQQ